MLLLTKDLEVYSLCLYQDTFPTWADDKAMKIWENAACEESTFWMSTLHVKVGTFTEFLNTPYVEIMVMINRYCFLASSSYI